MDFLAIFVLVIAPPGLLWGAVKSAGRAWQQRRQLFAGPVRFKDDVRTHVICVLGVVLMITTSVFGVLGAAYAPVWLLSVDVCFVMFMLVHLIAVWTYQRREGGSA